VPATKPVNWKYDAHKSLRLVQSIIAGMKNKTGRSLDEWLRLTKQGGPVSEKGRRDWLKEEHGLGANYAVWIAARSVGKNEEDEDPEQYLQHAQDSVEKMFSGPKEHLRAIYDEILKYARTMGSDIRVSPCSTIVPIYRKHVIAQIKPTTRTRIDLGLALKNAKVPKRLINTGGFEKKDRITHRIELSEPRNFDAEAKRWMKVAYEGDA
jgi:Domain of unknown function (DUF5655)/Domain of unknown function (DUF4287)